MNDATVWVTQVPNRRDQDTGMMVPAHNISPASEHGKIVIMMPADAPFYATADLVTQLRQRLRDYDFARGDSVVCLGDPAIIAVTGALLAEKNTRFAILRWDRLIQKYVRIEIALH
jgi:hypothetical protein